MPSRTQVEQQASLVNPVVQKECRPAPPPQALRVAFEPHVAPHPVPNEFPLSPLNRCIVRARQLCTVKLPAGSHCPSLLTLQHRRGSLTWLRQARPSERPLRAHHHRHPSPHNHVFRSQYLASSMASGQRFMHSKPGRSGQSSHGRGRQTPMQLRSHRHNIQR